MNNLPQVLRPLVKLPYYADDNVLRPYAQLIHSYMESITLRNTTDTKKLQVMAQFLTGLEKPHFRWFFECTFLRKYLLHPRQQGTIPIALLLCQLLIQNINTRELETDLCLLVPTLVHCFWAKHKVLLL